MNKLFYLACALYLLLEVASPSWLFAADAKKPGQSNTDSATRSAVDAVRDYTGMIKAGKGSAATTKKYWDVEAMMQTIFGAHLKQHSADEVKEINTLWLAFISKIYANPETMAALKQARFEKFESTEEDGGAGAIVTYQTKVGDTTISNKLRLKKETVGWKIVDMATNGQLFVESIQKAYEPQAKKITPLKFMQLLAAQQPKPKNDPPAAPK